MESASSSTVESLNSINSRENEDFEDFHNDMDLSIEDFRRRKTIGVIIRRGLKRFKKAVRMVIVLLRSGGILDTHKREFIDPVDLGKFNKICVGLDTLRWRGDAPVSRCTGVTMRDNFSFHSSII